MKRGMMSLVLMIGLGAGGCASVESEPPIAARHVVLESLATIERFTTIQRLAEFSKHIPSARAVVILPNLVKAGFIAGGEGGNGVLLAKGADGGWRGPVFMALGSASVGIQAGIQHTELVLLIRSDAALQAVLKRQGSFGAAAGVTFAVYGATMEGATTSNMGADIFAFANSKSGLFGGASLEGAVFVRRRDLNEAYYGPSATPDAILQGQFNNPEASALIRVLTNYTGAPAAGSPSGAQPTAAPQPAPLAPPPGPPASSKPVQAQPLPTPRR
ncbi:MAG: lipid-binding SYLF domain-containing protein [Rhodospirillaceae bacterium]